MQEPLENSKFEYRNPKQIRIVNFPTRGQVETHFDLTNVRRAARIDAIFVMEGGSSGTHSLHDPASVVGWVAMKHPRWFSVI
jgi:hypothetical protein